MPPAIAACSSPAHTCTWRLRMRVRWGSLPEGVMLDFGVQLSAVTYIGLRHSGRLPGLRRVPDRLSLRGRLSMSKKTAPSIPAVKLALYEKTVATLPGI